MNNTKLLAQQFVDSPSLENLKLLEVEMFSPGSPELYTFELQNLKSADNFWDFVFKSTEHLELVQQHLKIQEQYCHSQDNSQTPPQCISFNRLKREIPLESLVNYDPMHCSMTQNLFLAKTSGHLYQKNITNAELLDKCIDYWMELVRVDIVPGSYNMIKKFSDKEADKSMEELASDFMEIYDKTALVARRCTIALNFCLMSIVKNKKYNTDDKAKFSKLAAQHKNYDSSIRDNIINTLTQYELLNSRTYSISLDNSNNLDNLHLGLLYVRNILTHEFIIENKIIVEKDKLNQIVASNKNKKTNKL